MLKIFELTKENENDYLDQVASLEQIVLNKMNEDGRIGQLFITGKEDIQSYVHSKENTVIIAADDLNHVIAATYITQGQKPFTYNDITKYFKYSSEYKQYVRSKYDNNQLFLNDLLDIYKIKLSAFSYAKSRILAEYTDYSDIHSFIENEMKENGFHEKSILREKLNQYMSEYIFENFNADIQKKYEQFYFFTANDIASEFGKSTNNSREEVDEYEKFLRMEYEEILSRGAPIIYEEPSFDISKYFSANTSNSVELDTYLTLPCNRSAGIARIIIYEGIKKHINRYFKDSKNSEIFLCSTLHRDNLPSKYVSEFFGLKDSLYVNRRQNRDREVHICRINRNEYISYLSNMEKKLVVLYGYNPNNITVSDSDKKEILQEQLEYEESEYQRLCKCKSLDKSFKTFNLKFIESKFQKMSKLSKQIKSLNYDKGEQDYGEM